MTEIISIVLPIFLIIALGYGLRVVNLIREEWIDVLNSLVYYVALPAIILAGFWDVNWVDPTLQKLLLFNLTVLILFGGAVVLGLRTFHIDRLPAIFMTAIVGNTVYMGFPLGHSALGNEGFASVVTAATPHLVIGIALAILLIEFTRGGALSQFAKNFVRNPLIVAMVVGFVLGLVGWRDGVVTGVVRQTVDLLAGIASPVALLTLGAFIYGKFERRSLELALGVSVLKLVVFPLFVWAAAMVWGVTGAGLSASVLVAAMPTAVTTFVVSRQYHLDSSLVASTILLTTVFALPVLSVILYFLV